jgi:hypothetical protein
MHAGRLRIELARVFASSLDARNPRFLHALEKRSRERIDTLAELQPCNPPT